MPGGARNVQDIYPLAPLQEGILFHHLMAPKGDPYLLPLQLCVRYATAPGAVPGGTAGGDRTGTTSCARPCSGKGCREPVQVVWREAQLPVEEVELSEARMPRRQLRERFDPRHYRLDVREAPLLRAFVGVRPQAGPLAAAAAEPSPGVRPHDAGGDARRRSQAHLRGEQHRLPAPLPFRKFVAQARLGVSAEEHEAFFRGMLGDVEEPTAPFGWLDVRGDGGGIAEAHRAGGSGDSAQAIRRCARAAGVSAASLCHLAWAQVLARLTGREEVVFGTVLFGRCTGERVRTRAWGCSSTRCRCGCRSAGRVRRRRCASTHERLAELLRHEHASLALAQRCSGVPAAAPLFTSLLNYRHVSAADDQEQRTREETRFVYVEERTNYPLTLSVNDLGEAFELKAQVRDRIDARRVCELCTRRWRGWCGRWKRPCRRRFARSMPRHCSERPGC